MLNSYLSGLHYDKNLLMRFHNDQFSTITMLYITGNNRTYPD